MAAEAGDSMAGEAEDSTAAGFRALRAMAADIIPAAAIVVAIGAVDTAAMGATADGAAATDGVADGAAGIGAIRVTAGAGDLA
jgi:hypothetical protein